MQDSVPEARRKDVFAMLEQMSGYHPSEAHWFLPLIGVDPFWQGSGIGSALMERALIACDRDKKLVYLESSNPKNISLYERHGFEVLGTIRVGTSPPVSPMLRKPR
jgi:ribosomal protein S18 acetylase RimI-like enzyme